MSELVHRISDGAMREKGGGGHLVLIRIQPYLDYGEHVRCASWGG